MSLETECRFCVMRLSTFDHEVSVCDSCLRDRDLCTKYLEARGRKGLQTPADYTQEFMLSNQKVDFGFLVKPWGSFKQKAVENTPALKNLVGIYDGYLMSMILMLIFQTNYEECKHMIKSLPQSVKVGTHNENICYIRHPFELDLWTELLHGKGHDLNKILDVFEIPSKYTIAYLKTKQLEPIRYTSRWKPYQSILWSTSLLKEIFSARKNQDQLKRIYDILNVSENYIQNHDPIPTIQNASFAWGDGQNMPPNDNIFDNINIFQESNISDDMFQYTIDENGDLYDTQNDCIIPWTWHVLTTGLCCGKFEFKHVDHQKYLNEHLIKEGEVQGCKDIINLHDLFHWFSTLWYVDNNVDDRESDFETDKYSVCQYIGKNKITSYDPRTVGSLE